MDSLQSFVHNVVRDDNSDTKGLQDLMKILNDLDSEEKPLYIRRKVTSNR